MEPALSGGGVLQEEIAPPIRQDHPAIIRIQIRISIPVHIRKPDAMKLPEVAGVGLGLQWVIVRTVVQV